MRRFSLRGDPDIDYWVGNLIDNDFFLSVEKITRHDIFLSTVQHTYGRNKAIENFWEQLNWLRTGWLDLVYIAMPRGTDENSVDESEWAAFIEAYKVLHEISELECPESECGLQKDGKTFKRIRAIGVSDASYESLTRLIKEPGLSLPVVVQNKFDVYRQGELLLHRETQILELCEKHQIVIEAYDPVSGHPFIMSPEDDPHVLQISKALGKSPEQVMTRWTTQHGFVPTVSLNSKEKIYDLARGIYDFTIPDVWMSRISSIQWLAYSPLNMATGKDHYGVGPV